MLPFAVVTFPIEKVQFGPDPNAAVVVVIVKAAVSVLLHSISKKKTKQQQINVFTNHITDLTY